MQRRSAVHITRTAKLAMVLLLCAIFLVVIFDIPLQLHMQYSHSGHGTHSASTHFHNYDGTVKSCSICAHLHSVSQLIILISILYLFAALTAVITYRCLSLPVSAIQTPILLKTRINN